ncbi:hypothetical protein BDN71DRAFT_1405136 [Pleurotus eryngii]|uniref:Uncharacterized protein n=1 Tax=Pleurotus eryngii TaxID=5323 RepID=A0A9P6D175_PLEER|nr:hypothetical protein BDN71DRAFT_1405136 [Pleurotus eryngii]
MQLQHATAIKSKISNLQKQNKAETYSVGMVLWYFPLGGGAAKKAQLLPIHDPWNGTTPAVDVLTAMKDKIKEAHAAAPSRLDLDFTKVGFGINLSAKSVLNLEMTPDIIGGTLASMFSILKGKQKLSESDVKSRTLSLRLYLYENFVVRSRTFNNLM